MAENTVHEFRPDRGNILAAIMMAALCVIAIGYAPAQLFWILILPALFAYWAVKDRTQVDESGISLTYAFGKARKVAWDDVAGIGFKKSQVYVSSTSGEHYRMPGVTFNSIPQLSVASRGRIPDVVTQGKEATDGKVEVVNRDGDSILLTQEEFAEYEKTHKVNRAPASPPEETDSDN